jgi:hypothetical protein
MSQCPNLIILCLFLVTSFRDYGACFWKTCSYRLARPFFRPPHQEQTDCHTVLTTVDATLFEPPPNPQVIQLQQKISSQEEDIQCLISSISSFQTQIDQLIKLFERTYKDIPATTVCSCAAKLTELSNKYVSKEETDNYSNLEH